LKGTRCSKYPETSSGIGGELLECIGATTLDEYRKYIERDAASVNVVFNSRRVNELAHWRETRQKYYMDYAIATSSTIALNNFRLSTQKPPLGSQRVILAIANYR
jgi:hypothetical protein